MSYTQLPLDGRVAVRWPSGSVDVITSIELSPDLKRVNCYDAAGRLVQVEADGPHPDRVQPLDAGDGIVADGVRWTSENGDAWTHNGRLWVHAAGMNEPVDMGIATARIVAKLTKGMVAA